MISKLLNEWTGYGRRYWMAFVQNAVGRSAKVGEQDGCRPNFWVRDVVDSLWACLVEKVKKRKYRGIDGNVLCGRLLSLILSLWTCRVMRAKGHDPERSLSDRRGYLDHLNKFQIALQEAMVDERLDRVYFPEQDWVPPHPALAGAKTVAN